MPLQVLWIFPPPGSTRNRLEVQPTCSKYCFAMLGRRNIPLTSPFKRNLFDSIQMLQKIEKSRNMLRANRIVLFSLTEILYASSFCWILRQHILQFSIWITWAWGSNSYQTAEELRMSSRDWTTGTGGFQAPFLAVHLSKSLAPPNIANL